MSTPILRSLIEAGSIRIEDNDYIGTASDGVEVLIGNITNPTGAETYLTDHPTPGSW